MEKEESKDLSKNSYTQVFSWGDDRYGQLGLGDSGNGYQVHLTPCYCSYNIIIEAVSCGAAHTLLLTSH